MKLVLGWSADKNYCFSFRALYVQCVPFTCRFLLTALCILAALDLEFTLNFKSYVVAVKHMNEVCW